MEGEETSPSHHSEESSILDLPSVCDLAEGLSPHSTESSEELFSSVDTFPSPLTGESNLPSTVPGDFSAGGSEKANVRCYPETRMYEHTEPNDVSLSSMYEHDSMEDASITKSLESFYKTYCKKQPGSTDPTYEAASRCLSKKISELGDQGGTKYALRCLQMAQLVLNRDGCVSTVPVEKDHMEEMITRCIVEVLSNALSKPNAPPINPECKEILKKGGKSDRERSEDKQLEVGRLKEPSEFENPHSESVESEQSQAEDDSKKRVKGDDEEKSHPGEGNSKEDEEGRHIPVHEEKLHTEEKKQYQEIRRENSYHSEEDKENKESDGEDHAVLNKKSHSAGMSTEEVSEENDQRPMGHWHSEEGMQSPYKRIHEGEEGEAEEERSEKYHLSESKGRDFSQHEEHEESDESEEVKEEKKSYKPKRYHGKHRMGDSSEEKRGHGEDKEELAEESNTEESHLWDKRNSRQKQHHEESEQQHEEKSSYHGRHGSEGMEEKRHVGQGSVEYRDRWQQSEEKSQEENKRHHHSEESNEKWHEERRHHSEGREYRGGESEEELDRYHSDSSKEKQHHAGGRYRLWDNEGEGTQKVYTQEHKGQARTHYSNEDSVEQQHYPGNSDEEEEEVEKKHYSSDQIENEEENMEQGGYAEKEEYRSRLPAENEKRTAASYSSLYPLLWWKSQHLEKRNSAGERLPESKEESRPTLSEKNLFPEYSDYDWWDKKQLLSALNHGRSEKRNLSKRNRYDMKRQYDKMDQLAQLLNYRKKSAEFLELYNSGEDMKKRHVIRNDKGTLNQRSLTEEEAKELENLAAMDLELQKIAETFNGNRRG